jgi:hypothetical protein
VRRVITVLSAHPEGLRRNDLRRKIGKPYRLELVEVLDRLESEQMITRTDHLIKLIKGSTS